MGSSARPSQDAERDRGEEYDGTDGGGEELESSHRPGNKSDRPTFTKLNKLHGRGGRVNRKKKRKQLYSLSLVETGRIRLVRELRFLMAIVSWEE